MKKSAVILCAILGTLGGLGVNILISLLGAPIFFILMLISDNYFMVGGGAYMADNCRFAEKIKSK